MRTGSFEFDLHDLEAVLWRSRRPGPTSAWHEHVAFAHWLVHVQGSRCIVDLGTGHGIAYAAFCHATAARGVFARCLAVDTWSETDMVDGRSPASHASIVAFTTATYGFFASVLRMGTNEALGQCDAGSVDLVHLDGVDTYDQIHHHYETWLPKLSRRGVMLLHNAAVREQGYGVSRLMDELSWRYPTFRFEHGRGLGVLLIGRDQPDKLLRLCDLSGSVEIDVVRDNFRKFSQWSRVAPE